MEKQLFPYMPYCILRYEKEIKSETGNIDNAIKDWESFKSKLKETP